MVLFLLGPRASLYRIPAVYFARSFDYSFDLNRFLRAMRLVRVFFPERERTAEDLDAPCQLKRSSSSHVLYPLVI